MGLRIRTNVSSLIAQRRLEESSKDVGDSMERLASGYRINKAADDAAGLGVSETMRAKIRSMTVAKRNASDGVSLVQVAEGSMNEVSNIIVRLRELAVQAASDTIGNRERAFANKEYVALVDEIDRISSITEFNGVKLLRADDSPVGDTLTIHVGIGDGSVPNTDTIDIDLNKLRTISTEGLGITGEAAIGPLDLQDTEFNRATAAEKLKVLDDALLSVNSLRSELGAKQSRLNSTIGNLSIAQENLTASKSRIKDVDFASETASVTQSRILQQGGVSVLSQANAMPEVALTLLR